MYIFIKIFNMLRYPASVLDSFDIIVDDSSASLYDRIMTSINATEVYDETTTYRHKCVCCV